MKKIIFTSCALLSTILLANVASAATTGNVGGDDAAVTSNGTVSVTQGEAGGGEDTKDPENPDKPVVTDPDDVTPNPNTGTLIIQAVSNLKFGSISTGTTEVKKQAAAVNLTDDTGAAITRGAYVQWSDLRNTDRGYTITAAMKKQFTGTGANGAGASDVLNGSTIDYTTGVMNSAQEVGIWPEDNMATSFQLTEDGAAKTVVSADKASAKGKGEYFVEYGQSATWDPAIAVGANKGTADTADKAVTLTVPATTVSTMVLGDYQADILWTITAAP